MQALARYTTISNVFDRRETQNYPVLAAVEDESYSNYVIKHNSGGMPCNKLINEFLAYYFLQLWHIPTPQAALVEVKLNHIPTEYRDRFSQPAYFNVPCFATKYEPFAMEFLRFLEETMSYEKPKFINKTDLLKIVLFDMWLANDDRTAGNPNLLVLPVTNGYQFLAIDHEGIFNGGNLHRGLFDLTYDDVLLQHGGFQKILGKSFSNFNVATSLIEDAYICIEHCRENLDEILSYIPDEWQIDVNQLKTDLDTNIFSKLWLDKLKPKFLSHLQKAIN